ncbi:MAG: methyltransferase domain-containing protein [Acidobacteria bacterium]|nr:methyltransferase domain-containing protein [Acidobacteriota bacterium]
MTAYALQRRTLAGAALLLLVAAVVFVADQMVRTLGTLTAVERERDTWQRPEEIIGSLDLRPGQTVVDLGSGAGYFALKMAPLVAPTGRVLAVDLRRQSLAFLWIRARQGGLANLAVIHGEPDNPRLPPGPVDAALIANTYHELTAPDRILKVLFTSMRPGARLVVVDRGPRASTESRSEATAHHELTATAARDEITRHGFLTEFTDERFIDRAADEDIWWLMVFRKP